MNIFGRLGYDQGDHYTMIKCDGDGWTIITCVYRDLNPKALVAFCGASVLSDKVRYYKDSD
jgi:hypothetical protein